MIQNKLINFKTRAQFDTKLKAGEVSTKSIVFIEDTGEIWTHGKFFAKTNGSDHNHDGSYVKYNDVVMNTNPFGGKKLYINSINNAMYAADKRFIIKATRYNLDGTGASDISSSVGSMFNGSYETGLSITANKKVVIEFDFNPKWSGYPYGTLYLSFYHSNIPLSVEGRVYNDYEPHGIGWHTLSFTKFNDAPTAMIYSSRQDKYGLCKLELTITAKSDTDCKLTQVDYNLDRPHPMNASVIGKFAPEQLYYNLTNNESFIGKSFIKSGSDDTYILLGGGGQKAISDFSLSDHNHNSLYAPISHSNITSGNPHGVSYQNIGGTVPTWNQNTTGNAATVTNGVYTNADQTISGKKTFSSQQAFTVAQGTAPFTVGSNTLVTNLNADLLDGLNSLDFAHTLGQRNFGSNNDVTTAEFVELLKTAGMFRSSYNVCRGSWNYAGQVKITDTGLGIIGTAGSIIEVIGVTSAYTIRITLPSTSSGGTTNQEYIYVNNGSNYTPGWRRVWNNKNFNPDLKANLASPSFTGTPTAPTATPGTNTDQLATTAFVRKEVSDLVGGAPESLDTLKEIADYLTNDSIAGSIVQQLASKVSKAGDTMTGDLLIQKGNAWVTLDSESTGTDGNEQGAGISIGEHGKKGSAAVHLTYTGDGFGHLGMGAVGATTSLPAQESIRFYYTDNIARFAVTPEIGFGATRKKVSLEGHTHSYLPLTGGVISTTNATPLTINRTGGDNVNVRFLSDTSDRYLGFHKNILKIGSTSDLTNGDVVWHSGNLSFGTDSTNMATGNHTHNLVYATDKRDVKPNSTGISTSVKAIKPFFSSSSNLGISTSYGTYSDLLVMDTYHDSSGGRLTALAFPKATTSAELFVGSGAFNDAAWGTFNRVWTSGNSNNTSSDWSAKSLTLAGGISGATTIASSGSITAGTNLAIANTDSTKGYGLSLYGGGSATPPTYGMMFAGTGTFGKHGGVTGDWATYLTMSDTSNRGWIFRRGSTNVASINCTGDFSGSSFNGMTGLGGTGTATTVARSDHYHDSFNDREVSQSGDAVIYYTSLPLQKQEKIVVSKTTIVKGSDLDNGAHYPVVYLSSEYGSYTISEFIPVEIGETLEGSIMAMRKTGATGTAGTLYVGIERYDKNKKPIASNQGCIYVVGAATVPSDNTWRKYSGLTTMPLSHTVYGESDGGPVRYVKIRILVNYSSGTMPMYISGIELKRNDKVVNTYSNQTISGTKTFSSTISGSITGNSGTATKLATIRTINGTNFDGSDNITTANWGTARDLTIGGKTKSVNGSGNVSWTLAEIGAAAGDHTHSYLPLSGGTLTGALNGTMFTATNSGKKLEMSATSSYTRIQSIGGIPLSINPEGNNVAIGKTTASEMLEVGGNIKASVGIYDSARIGDRTFYNVATKVATASAEKGIIKITMPYGFINNMGTYEIDIYEYNSRAHSKIYIGCYNFSGSSFNNCNVKIIGELSAEVRLAYDGTKCCILIGKIDTVWTYPQIYVTKVTQGHVSSGDISKGWAISFLTSETGLSLITTPVNSKYLSSSNYTNYVPSKTGSGASGTWGISISGNAATATRLGTTGTAATSSQVVMGNGTGKNIGSGSADVAAGNHTHSYLPLSGGTLTDSLLIKKGRSFDPESIGMSIGNLHLVTNDTTADYISSITFSGQPNSASQAQAGIYVQGSGSYGTKMYFATTNSHATGPIKAMVIDHFGDVWVKRKLNAVSGLQVNGVDVSLSNHTHSYLPLSGGILTGNIIMPNLMMDFKSSSNGTTPQLLGYRGDLDLNLRLFATEAGFSWTTYNQNTLNKPSGVTNNANGVLTVNTHNGLSYTHQLSFNYSGQLHHRVGTGAWTQICKFGDNIGTGSTNYAAGNHTHTDLAYMHGNRNNYFDVKDLNLYGDGINFTKYANDAGGYDAASIYFDNEGSKDNSKLIFYIGDDALDSFKFNVGSHNPMNIEYNHVKVDGELTVTNNIHCGDWIYGNQMLLNGGLQTGEGVATAGNVQAGTKARLLTNADTTGWLQLGDGDYKHACVSAMYANNIDELEIRANNSNFLGTIKAGQNLKLYSDQYQSFINMGSNDTKVGTISYLNNTNMSTLNIKSNILKVYGATQMTSFRLFRDITDTNAFGIDYKSNSNYPRFIWFNDPDGHFSGYSFGVRNTERLWIDSTGCTSIRFNQTSDRRLKENIIPLENSLTKISKLKPVKFNFIGEDRLELGFIAQEMQQVYPELVTPGKDGILSLNYIGLISVLTKTVQELTAKVAELEYKVNTPF